MNTQNWSKKQLLVQGNEPCMADLVLQYVNSRLHRVPAHCVVLPYSSYPKKKSLRPPHLHAGLNREFLAWLILRPWRCRRYVPPKRRLTFDGLHGVISQKTELSTTWEWIETRGFISDLAFTPESTWFLNGLGGYSSLPFLGSLRWMVPK
jgi:hypothetical protein